MPAPTHLRIAPTGTRHIGTFHTGTLLAALLTVATATPASAGCDATRALDTPTANFTVQGATVIDKATGLEWRRCSHGLEWKGGACVGRPAPLPLAEAIKLGERTGDGWRLPTAQEMDSILESACTAPAINAEVFPDIHPSDADAEDDWVYWSATHYDIIPKMAYVFNYGNGITDVRSPGYPLSVRLVRGPAKPR